MKNYGKGIKWSTIGAPNPAGGICEEYLYSGQFSEDDHDQEDGDHFATILHDRMGELSWGTKLTDDATIPVLEGGCLVSVSGISAGLVLLREVVESWGLREKRSLRAQAQHFPDATGGDTDAAALDEMPEITSPPICFPAGKLAWGTKGVASTLGIVQRFTITQSVTLTPYSEEGKIVSVIACNFQLRYVLEVLALTGAARPEEGQELTLSTAPDRFEAGNFITRAAERSRLRDGVMFEIDARWTPALASGD